MFYSAPLRTLRNPLCTLRLNKHACLTLPDGRQSQRAPSTHLGHEGFYPYAGISFQTRAAAPITAALLAGTPDGNILTVPLKIG